MINDTFHYWQCGLDYVYLQGGVEWVENDYGRFYNIKNVDQLHDVIAHEIVTSPKPLRGQELRFLRSLLELSQEALAKRMGMTRSGLAKLEAEPNKKLSSKTDRHLRLTYLVYKTDPGAYEEMKELLEDIAEDEYQKDLSLSLDGGNWGVAFKAA